MVPRANDVPTLIHTLGWGAEKEKSTTFYTSHPHPGMTDISGISVCTVCVYVNYQTHAEGIAMPADALVLDLAARRLSNTLQGPR